MPESENQPFQNLRRALLNWYPFEKGITALLCGRNTDVLVPLLKAHVDKLEHPDLEQLADIISEREPEKTFDLIVAADVLEFWQGDGGELLTRLVGRLKDDGILLLGFRNRFGIKYMCGGLDEAMQIPFSMLPPFSATSEEKPKLFAREEINGLLRKAGCSDLRYYYLMPDGEFPQVVFTDDLLPEGSFRDRVMPYDPFRSPLIASEKGLYDDVVRERMLPFVANYYLVECRKKEKKGKDRKVIHAALSTDRGPDHGFATVLYSDETVEKILLSPQGKAALKTLYENLENLRAHGLETVDQVLTEDRICMSLIREESSLQYLERNLASASEAFLSVFERIIQDALKSSESFLMTDEEAKSAWGVSSGELGPILEKGYIDMIPYNAFWTGKQLRYYDQEFSRTNCPVKYILFRALRYTWLHIPEAETVFPLEEMKQRFGLEKLWERYGNNPKRLAKGVKMLRQMKGLGNANDFYEGVETHESFELDFKPIEENSNLTPVMLIIILDLYFRLTPNTMVKSTPEIKQLSRLLKIDTDLIVEVMEIYQICDPYLNRMEILTSPLITPCNKIWKRYGNGNPEKLAAYAAQLKEYFK